MKYIYIYIYILEYRDSKHVREVRDEKALSVSISIYLAHDAEGGRDDPRGETAVHSLLENVDAEGARDEPAEGGGAPHLLVVAAAGVETDDERGRADLRRVLLNVERQVGAAALLGGLDEDNAPGVGITLGLQSHHRRKRAKQRVPVVSTATPVQLAVHNLQCSETNEKKRKKGRKTVFPTFFFFITLGM